MMMLYITYVKQQKVKNFI